MPSLGPTSHSLYTFQPLYLLLLINASTLLWTFHIHQHLADFSLHKSTSLAHNLGQRILSICYREQTRLQLTGCASKFIHSMPTCTNPEGTQPVSACRDKGQSKGCQFCPTRPPGQADRPSVICWRFPVMPNSPISNGASVLNKPTPRASARPQRHRRQLGAHIMSRQPSIQ